MALLKGRERFLYSPRPGWSMVIAGYFVVVGLALLVIGLLKSPVVAAFALLPFAFAAWSFYRAKWTRAHPEVQERVQRKSDERLTAHPVKYMLISVLVLGGAGAYELWRLTMGPGHHHGAPPVWAWPAVVIAGMAMGYVSWRSESPAHASGSAGSGHTTSRRGSGKPVTTSARRRSPGRDDARSPEPADERPCRPAVRASRHSVAARRLGATSG
jgi:hypothetical protein